VEQGGLKFFATEGKKLSL